MGRQVRDNHDDGCVLDTNLMIYSDDENWSRIPESQRRELGLTFEDDGEFYMDFNDFLQYFGTVDIVHKTPGKMMADQETETKFEVMHFEGAWDSHTAGGCDCDGNFLNINKKG